MLLPLKRWARTNHWSTMDFDRPSAHVAMFLPKNKSINVAATCLFSPVRSSDPITFMGSSDPPPISQSVSPGWNCSRYLWGEQLRGLCVSRYVFEAAAVKNEAGRGNSSTLEGHAAAFWQRESRWRRTGRWGGFFFPCEAGHDEIDAVSPRLHQPHSGEDGYVEDEGGERRGIFLHPQASTSTWRPPPTLTHPPTPPSLWGFSLQWSRAHFSLFSLSRAIRISVGVERDDRTPMETRGMNRERKSFTVQRCRVNSPPRPPPFNFPTMSWLISHPIVWQPPPHTHTHTPQPHHHRHILWAFCNLSRYLSSCMPGATLKGIVQDFLKCDCMRYLRLVSGSPAVDRSQH